MKRNQRNQVRKSTTRTAPPKQAQSQPSPFRTSPDKNTELMREQDRFWSAMREAELYEQKFFAFIESLLGLVQMEVEANQDDDHAHKLFEGLCVTWVAIRDGLSDNLKAASNSARSIFPQLRSEKIEYLRPSLPCREASKTAVESAAMSLQLFGGMFNDYDPASGQKWHDPEIIRTLAHGAKNAAANLREKFNAADAELEVALHRFYPRLAEKAEKGGAQ